MSGVYRGPGGTGDATGDAVNQASIAIIAATSAATSATEAATSASNASTSASNAATAAASINLSSIAITGGTITGITDLAIADGGTGASTAANARTNLGLGTIATQSASTVAVTGGAIDGTTVGSTTRSSVKATTLDLGLSTQSVAIGQGNASLMKNRLINGACVIDQRNAGASVTPTTSAFTLDRWALSINQASKFSVQQNAGSVTPPVGFSNYLGVTSLSAYSVLTGDYFSIAQYIEGFNTADLGWGTANAKTVTLSFRVYSSLTGTFGGSLSNSAFNYSYPFTYSIPVANTWTTISVTIAGPTAGTWIGATNGLGLRVYFGLGAGATYSGTAGSWSTNGYYTATGATSVVGTSGATFYITGIQLEVGSSATGFEYRQYGQELYLCQRYYQFGMFKTGASYGLINYFQMMRATPTVVQSSLPFGGTAFGTQEYVGSTSMSYTGSPQFQYTLSAEI